MAQLQQKRLGVRDAVVESDAPLIVIVVNESEAFLRAVDSATKWRHPPKLMTARMLNQNDIGTEVSEQFSTIGARPTT